MKKGFTLIEIIVIVVLITMICVISFVSYNWMDKKKTIETLKGMSKEILSAANVYMT